MTLTTSLPVSADDSTAGVARFAKTFGVIPMGLRLAGTRATAGLTTERLGGK